MVHRHLWALSSKCSGFVLRTTGPHVEAPASLETLIDQVDDSVFASSLCEARGSLPEHCSDHRYHLCFSFACRACTSEKTQFPHTQPQMQVSTFRRVGLRSALPHIGQFRIHIRCSLSKLAGPIGFEPMMARLTAACITSYATGQWSR